MKYLSMFLTLVICNSYAIVGGERVRNNEFKNTLGLPVCTAVLVHPRIILTAAHCLHEENFPRGLRHANINLNLGNRGGHSNSKRIIHAKAHLEYRFNQAPGSAFYIHKDFAYILLEDEISDIPPAEIAFHEFDKSEFNKFWSVGFGGNNRNPIPVDQRRKRKVDLRFHSERSGRINLYGIPSERRRLFGRETVYKNLCAGDSGGPVYSENDSMKLVALAVAAPKECKSADSSIFEPVTNNLCWVQRDSGVFLGMVGCN